MILPHAAMPKERIDRRAIWRLIQPYWVSEEKWRARGLLLAIVALALSMVYLEVLFNTWNREFYNALEPRITRYSSSSCGASAILHPSLLQSPFIAST